MPNSDELADSTLRTTFFEIGGRPRPVVYSIVDGLAIAEDCIILGTAEQAEATLRRIQKSPALLRAGAGTFGHYIRGSQFRWPRAIVPYQISPNLQAPERVTEAVQHWEAQTHIQLPLRTEANAELHPNYIEFVPGSQCASSVGMQGGRQVITLGPSCSAGKCIHEIGHALGLWHEHSRFDRDAFIEVLWDNLSIRDQQNYSQRLNDGVDSGPYDYSSIMHYPLTTADGTPILRATRNTNGAVIGQRERLSQGDKDTIASMYPP